MSTIQAITSCLLRDPVEPEFLLRGLVRLLGVEAADVRPLLEEAEIEPRFRVEHHTMDRGFRSYITVYGNADPASILGTDLQLARALAHETGMDALAAQPGTYASWTLVRPDGTERVVQQDLSEESDGVIVEE